jgi:hypothetical protein
MDARGQSLALAIDATRRLIETVKDLRAWLVQCRDQNEKPAKPKKCTRCETSSERGWA